MNTIQWNIVTKWDLPFSDYLGLMDGFKKLAKNKPQTATLLICSHPRCFTNGRGLQRQPGGKILPDLIAFNETQAMNLPFPLYQISRAGGLTFHYPGQIILYPIAHIGRLSVSLLKLMFILLKTTEETLNLFHDLSPYEMPKEHFGLWTKNKKIASIGMSLDKDITEHGIAINLHHDHIIFLALSKIFPCGLSGNIYSSVEQLSSTQIHRDRFLQHFTEILFKQIS
jgi:lipoate-protein ligase B